MSEQGKADEAIRYFRESLRVRPGAEEILDWLAQAYAAAGQHEIRLRLHR
jgi:predicted Zn-dependent protease